MATSMSSQPDEGHIMISYSWNDQRRVIQVRDGLKKLGYQVWMDIDSMQGSTLEAMVEAVEKSAVVLVCMSEHYKQSANCRMEAEYAFVQKKTIVPLLMQQGYRPDGWLGILAGAKLYFNFSGNAAFDKALDGLRKELGDRGKLNQGSQTGSPERTVRKSEDVAKWLREKHLENCLGLADVLADSSKNDKVKSVRVEKRDLDVILKLLDSGGSQDRHDAANLLWNISFNEENKIKMQEHTELMETLKSLSSSADQAPPTIGLLLCRDVFTRIGMDKSAIQQGDKKTTVKSPEQGYIMISYCWADGQEKAKKVCDALKMKGYPVWMDNGNMTGKINDCMAKAVENAAAVLPCMSEGYKNSDNCQKEAEYADHLKKAIIPLLIQEHCKLDGWLGFLFIKTLYVNFSGATSKSFDEAMNKLLEQLDIKKKHGVVFSSSATDQ